MHSCTYIFTVYTKLCVQARQQFHKIIKLISTDITCEKKIEGKMYVINSLEDDSNSIASIKYQRYQKNNNNVPNRWTRKKMKLNLVISILSLAFLIGFHVKFSF